jgi:Ni/Co efflux regulator RcnB
MKKLMSVLLGLSFVLGSVAIAQTPDKDTTKKETKKKSGKKGKKTVEDKK